MFFIAAQLCTRHPCTAAQAVNTLIAGRHHNIQQNSLFMSAIEEDPELSWRSRLPLWTTLHLDNKRTYVASSIIPVYHALVIHVPPAHLGRPLGVPSHLSPHQVTFPEHLRHAPTHLTLAASHKQLPVNMTFDLTWLLWSGRRDVSCLDVWSNAAVRFGQRGLGCSGMRLISPYTVLVFVIVWTIAFLMASRQFLFSAHQVCLAAFIYTAV